MRRKLVFCMAILVSFSLLTASGSAQSIFDRLSFRLSGGYGSFLGGDMTKFTNGINDQVADKMAVYGFTTRDEVENAKWDFEFGGEIILGLSERFSIGLGVEYAKKKIDSTVSVDLGADARASLRWQPEYSVTPIKLSGYYIHPVSQKIRAFLKAGIGYYPAKINFNLRQEQELLGVLLWEEDDGEADKSGVGFHGALGLEYVLTENIAFFIEGMGRYVNLKNWKAQNTHTNPGGNIEETGDLWYGEALDFITGKYYPAMFMQEQEPSGGFLRNVRKAEIDFSGFVVRIGIRVRLGKVSTD